MRSAADKTNRLTSDENITSLAKVINEKEKLKKNSQRPNVGGVNCCLQQIEKHAALPSVD